MMTRIIGYCAALGCFSTLTLAERSGEIVQNEAKQVAFWKGNLANARLKSPSERPEELWLGLRNMAHWMSNGTHSSAVEETYRDIQQELLGNPGHSIYFAEKLETIRSEDHTQGKIKYGRYLHLYVAETLVHLPSPETVAVLGKMLEDTRDAPPPDNPARDLIQGYTMNPHLAAVALSKMKVRDHPLGREFFPVLHNLNPWLEWWKEVKAGERTFSFEGMDVEYRFKPDGTWDTIPLVAFADDGSTAMEGSVSKVREKKVKQVPSQPEVPLNSRWGWITAATVFLLGAVLWFSLKSKRAKP